MHSLLWLLAAAPMTFAATPQALNPYNQNTIDNGSITLYYNGTGPVPPYDMLSPVPQPITPLNNTAMVEEYFYQAIFDVTNGSYYSDDCTKCITASNIIHLAAITQPVSTVQTLLIQLCEAIPAFQSTIYAKTCQQEFAGIGDIGPYYAQLFSMMSVATGDMQAWCYFYYACPSFPSGVEIDESLYFDPKPDSANTVPTPSGQEMNVLHLSDWHLDPRYDIGSEANCSQYLCCRPYATNDDLDTTASNASVPASRFGYLYCDSPPDLALSAFTEMPQFFPMSNISFAIFTGDIVSHDNDDQLSRAYIEYEEQVTYTTFKKMLNNIPVYPTLGNHDSLPEAYNTQNALNPTSDPNSNALSWNYDLLTSMWAADGWITAAEESYAKAHYAAYAHTTAQGLRIISINTDFWYVDNVFNYWNFSNPDTSGVLTFLAQELTACEKAGQRAWIIGHVLSGFDGTNGLPNPTSLFYAIVRRFSPATIAGIFFGHTHENQNMIYYDFLANSTSAKNGKTLRNASMVDYTKPLMHGFIGSSITPLTGLNAGYQVYQVDSKTFEVTGSQVYFANVSDSLNWVKPEWQFEYDARATYGPAAAKGLGMKSWPANAPLNGTFWHGVTEEMLKNQTLVELYNLLETKSSIVTESCSTKACGEQKVSSMTAMHLCIAFSGFPTSGVRDVKSALLSKHGPQELLRA